MLRSTIDWHSTEARERAICLGEWTAKPSAVADHPAPAQLSSAIIPVSAVQNLYNLATA
jgi:hypothetical protein